MQYDRLSQQQLSFFLLLLAGMAYSNVFQPFQWSGTVCSNFDCSRNPCLLGGPRFL